MATFKAAGGVHTLTGDASRDVSLLRDIIYNLEEQLRYIFENIGIDNMNATEWGMFKSEFSSTLLARAAAGRTAESNAIYAALADIVTAVDGAIADVQRQIGDILRQLGTVEDDLADIAVWRSSVATTKTAETSEPVTIPPNEDVTVLSMTLPAGSYLLLSISDYIGDGIDTSDLRVSLNVGGNHLISVAYAGALVECNFYLVLDAENSVTLTATHTGIDNLTCKAGRISAIKIGGGTT